MSLLTDPFPTVEQLPALRHGAGGMPSFSAAPLAAAGPSARQRAEEGYAEGVLRGYEDGRRAATEEARSDLQFALTALHGAIEDLHRRDAAGLTTLATETIELALAIAETVIGREIDAAIDPGRDALARALALAPERGGIIARLNPSDLDRIGDLDSLAGGRDLDLIPDSSIASGDCVVDVGPAHIDAQIAAALARVRNELVGDLAPDPEWTNGGGHE